MKCYLLRFVWLSLLSLVLLPSCSILKKSRTRIITEIRVDTIIKVVRDTVPVIGHGTLYDTIKIENTTSVVLVYFDTTKKEIIATLTGKPFYVPIKIREHITTINTIKEYREPKPWYKRFWLIVSVIGLIIIMREIYLIKRK